MGVKNLSAIGPSGNIKPIPIHHAIPPAANAIIKVTVDTDSGEIDITDLILTATFNLGVTSTIGDFSLEFLDAIKTNYNKIDNFDDVYVYADYGTEATTKRHRFKIEDKGYTENYNTTISGRGIGMILAETNVIYSTRDANYTQADGTYVISGNLTSKPKSTIIKEIFYKYFPDITDFSNIEDDTTEVQRNYAETPFFDIIEELCGNDKYFYLDKDMIPHYFTKGSQTNTTEAISESNLVAVSNNSDNSEEIYTRVRLYGYTESNLPIISTVNIGTTNTNGVNKDYIINNVAVTTQTQADEIAQSYADYLTSSRRIGDIVSLCLPSLTPGDSFFIGLPDQDLDPGYYNIKEFSINIDNNGDYPLTTSFAIEKRKLDTSQIVKNIVQTQSSSTDNPNQYDLDYSKIITFEEDTGTHSNTEINEDYLKVSSGSSGTWISDIYTLSDDISKIYVGWSGEDLVGQYQSTSSQLWVSVDGGSTWKYMLFTGETTIPTGRDLRVKVVLNKSDAKAKRIGIYYNL